MSLFLPILLGGAVNSSGSFNFELNEETLNHFPELTTVILTIATILGFLGIFQLVFGGILKLGHCQYMLDLSFIGWELLNALTLGILGIFYLNPYISAAHTVFYRTLQHDSTEIK